MIQNTLFNVSENLDTQHLLNFGTTVVIAPHQDDESLGCGGTIALLRNLGLQVHVIFVSDGSKSHPNSKMFPAHKLVSLRKHEAISALNFLGVTDDDITFLDLPDGQLPHHGDPKFEDASFLMQTIIEKVKPQTLIFPWRRDPHVDHRATWEIINRAIEAYGGTFKKLEYFIWLWERAEKNDLPKDNEGTMWSVNISTVIDQKRKAIAAHISQTTRLIDDDPDGFILSAEVLEHFSGTTELFFEA